MDPRLLRIFQRQVATYCKNLIWSAEDCNAALQRGDIERVFYCLQNMLTAGANISKALWGHGGKLAAKRKALRDSLGVEDTSALRGVDMRNNFEHFDERLDRWWEQSKRHNFIDSNLGPPDMIVGADRIDMFRHFDPHSGNMIFWGDAFNLKALLAEAIRILPAATREAEKWP